MQTAALPHPVRLTRPGGPCHDDFVKTLVIVVVIVVLFVLARRLLGGPSVSPSEAAQRVQDGSAILVDVREPAEWQGGVAGPALLLSLGDLRGKRDAWRPVLDANRDKEFILYCASGTRSGIAAGILRKEGFNAVNAGGFGSWRAAGLPVRQP
ncbi:MAG: rhodanese-like domain-containing protein [Chthoniobacterales bacterium]|nr:rhodanese-like domain-containing protein [Chthoniobacterales bacterium]